MHQNQSWFAGVDWASQKHDVWLADASGKRLGKRTFEHSGEGLAQMCDWLIATSGGKPEDSQLKEVHRQLDKLCRVLAEPHPGECGGTGPEQGQVQRTVAILESLPGVGRLVLAILLAEASGVLQRADYAVLRILCGVAPVTRCSGKSRIVTRRLACNPRLRNAIHYLADAHGCGSVLGFCKLGGAFLIPDWR